jgi:hypothetical protein
MMLQYKIGKIMRARGDCQGSPRAARFPRGRARRGGASGVSILGWAFDVFATPARQRERDGRCARCKKGYVPSGLRVALELRNFETPREQAS